jgi:uncharacterized circularly permuted ATP-grasp superfamily protein
LTESNPKVKSSTLTAGTVTPGSLAAYVPDARRYDELLDDKGLVRPHWQPLIDQLTGDDARAVARRGLERTRRLIVENGVTYNVYADPQGADRPWALDPVPLLLLADEWREMEAGLAQRVRLLDALLADIYGPQRLLSEGLVPPELVFGHPNYLWPCQGIAPRGGNWLHVYAADLARAPDGRWWLLADRTQAPSGAGYALENREIVEQVLPEAIRQLEVRRISRVCSELREQLLSHGDEGENPLAVILTPGPFNETYFEHAYLSRQLGVPLAEGTDLTVRDDTVYLKTLAGLKRVHTILRRLDDDFCDPLELRSDSTLGIPGLLGVVRANRVVMANALGTGVLESAAWLGFLPRIAERLLGEKLSLPSVATWWCGEKPALDYVVAHLDKLVIKPTYPNQRFEPVFGRNLEGEARRRVIQRLRGRPYAYVAQEHLSLSQTPIWRPHGALGFAATPVSIRMYAIAGLSGTRVMPGGLARVAARSDEGVWNAAVKFCRDLGVIAIDGDAAVSLRDDRNPQGVMADVRRLAWCASQVRTRLSASYWRAVNEMQRRLQDSIAAREEPRAALDQLLLSLAALAGFAFDDMTQDEGWRLLRVGRRLERLQFAAGLLAQHLASEWATRQSHVEWLLEAYDSTRIYRSRYVVAPRLGPMLDLLVRDSEHPRALAFQWRAIARDLETLATSLGITGELGLDEAIPQLSDAKLMALESEGAEAVHARQSMAERLRALSWAAGQLSDRLSLRHFSHIAQDAQALAT